MAIVGLAATYSK